MENLDLYESARFVPDDVKKTIKGGRISGMTDINPMRRVKALTEQSGPCGIGQYYIPTRKWLETLGNEAVVFVDIESHIKVGGEWPKPILGNGGNMFAAKEKFGVYAPDECYKTVITDAISVACKQFGIDVDVHRKSDRTKYNREEDPDLITKSEVSETFLELKQTGIGVKNVLSKYGLTDIHCMMKTQAKETINKLRRKPDRESATAPPDDMQEGGLPWNDPKG